MFKQIDSLGKIPLPRLDCASYITLYTLNNRCTLWITIKGVINNFKSR